MGTRYFSDRKYQEPSIRFTDIHNLVPQIFRFANNPPPGLQYNPALMQVVGLRSGDQEGRDLTASQAAGAL